MITQYFVFNYKEDNGFVEFLCKYRDGWEDK